MALKITLLSAKLSKDLDTFTQMDPYAILQIGGTKFTSKTINSGGKQPQWNQCHTFDVQGQKMYENLKITVWDKDLISDDYVGQASIPVKSCVTVPSKLQLSQLNLTKDNEIVGTIKLSHQFIDNWTEQKHETEIKIEMK